MTIPDPIAWGHVLMLAGILSGLLALVQLAIWASNRGHGRGTPRYARARDARRFAIWSLLLGALFYAAGCFTPLRDMAIV